MSEIASQNKRPRNDKPWLAAGGVLGAILTSSCCILPLILISIGVSGAWIGSLTALDAYKPAFMAVAGAFIAVGFWRVYFAKPAACEDGSVCAKAESGRFTKTALWTSTILVLLAATIDFGAPLFY